MNINNDLTSEKMKISIFGMGYVGAVTAVCLASKGHLVTGVDTNEGKVEMINNFKSPIIEKDLPELFEAAKEARSLNATCDVEVAIQNTDISMICVGTPSNSNGSLDSKYLIAVSTDIALALKAKTNVNVPHIIIYRSTMLPGLLTNTIVPLLEEISCKKNGIDFFVCFNPEFLRESTSVFDFFNPPKTVVGTEDEWVAQQVFSLYGGLPGPFIHTSLKVAEMVKYVDNLFHALKITFANEIGQICNSLDIDSHEVMNIFTQDTKLNISKAYLKPGFAFGGSCLPKDLRAINYITKVNDINTPLLSSLLVSNESLIDTTAKKIMALGKKRIGVAGFSFKSGTDDLRESPIVALIEILIGKGYDLKLYDKYVSIARVVGANKEYINKSIPHISSLMVNGLEELLEDREVIIIGNNDNEFLSLYNNNEIIIFDLVRINKNISGKPNHITI